VNWNKATILVTGGSGSFGRSFTHLLFEARQPQQVIIFSRDEQRQHAMRRAFGCKDGRVRYVLGDVRDRNRLDSVMRGVDVVVHLAALKHVDDCEIDPFEAVQTNVHGTENVVRVAANHGVEKVVLLSTDKSVHPVNVYGATKMIAERIVLQANAEQEAGGTRFACMRSGNFFGSSGSVVPLFLEQRATGTLTITDPGMTRFVITLREAAAFMIRSVEVMKGGEIFVPKLPSVRITDLARSIGPDCRLRTIGLRPGERLFEVFVSAEESPHTVETDDAYVVLGKDRVNGWAEAGKALPHGFHYTSENNGQWLSEEELRRLLAELLHDHPLYQAFAPSAAIQATRGPHARMSLTREVVDGPVT
jgi:UDP-N-acetylglucosamine 4,6-dehydratase/5-epimerase